MKRNFYLLALGLLVGLSPLAVSSPDWQPVSHQSVVAQAALVNNRGTLTVNDTQIPWTLDNGTLTLEEGTLHTSYTENGVIPGKDRGRLLLYLANSPDLDKPMDYAGFQANVTHIRLSGKVKIGPVANFFFADFDHVSEFEGLENLDVSTVTNDASHPINTGLSGFFANMPKLQVLTVPALSSTNGHDASIMFAEDAALISLDMSNFDNYNVLNYSNMFDGDKKLRDLNLANWQSMRINISGSMFKDTTSLQVLTLSPKVLINSKTSFQGSKLSAPPVSDNYTGNWQAVAPGRVDFVNDDHLGGFLNYNPLGSEYSHAELQSRYSGTPTAEFPAPTGNETYVWEPTDKYRLIAPDPVTPPRVGQLATPEDDTIDFQPFNVVATKKIGLYSGQTFTPANRLVWFAKKNQMKQPTFRVTDVVTNANERDRYHVRDVNQQSNTYGKTGYITTNTKYVTHAYYQNQPQAITVINPRGINGYQIASLKNKVAHYRQGQQLMVKDKHVQGSTIRFQLTDNTYISANKHFVSQSPLDSPTKVQAKTALNRYDSVNLTGHNRHYARKQQATFKILGWDYSRGNDYQAKGTLRYKVAGGYITGNSRFVKVIE